MLNYLFLHWSNFHFININFVILEIFYRVRFQYWNLVILFSGDHYDCLIPKNDDKTNKNADYNVDKEDLKNKSHADVKELIINYNL